MSKQTMLINEKKLNMMNPEDRKVLEKEMVNFLFEGKDVHIEGYTRQKNKRSGPPFEALFSSQARIHNE